MAGLGVISQLLSDSSFFKKDHTSFSVRAVFVQLIRGGLAWHLVLLAVSQCSRLDEA